jgi:hypothetical protein
MKKVNIKLLIILLCGLFLLSGDFALAGKLEVNYPTSQSGISLIDTNTPIPIFLKYIFDMGMFLGLAAAVYSLGYAGYLYLRSGMQAEYRSQAKDRVVGAITGILILMMTYLIITTLNPQLKFFDMPTLKEMPPIAQEKANGIYFFKEDVSNGCTGEAQSYTSNINDFGELNNKINSVLIVNNAGDSYVSTMYSSPGLFGKCQDIDPNNYNCQAVDKFASSASIHIYDFKPQNNPYNDGVYFYRKPFYNPEGGFIKIDNNQIINTDGFFSAELKDLTFQNVPIEDKVCNKWDEKGVCIEKKDPTLAGKEISSIKIMGNYIIYFVYFDPEDKPKGPWSYCQEFPTPDDTNREGPKQFKWEKTPNQRNLANWVYIYPVKQK